MGLGSGRGHSTASVVCLGCRPVLGVLRPFSSPLGGGGGGRWDLQKTFLAEH